MKQFFSFNRFNLLVLKHWTENKKIYGLSVLAYFGLLLLRFLFSIIVHDHQLMPHDIQQITFFFPLFIIGTFYASQYFSELGSRAKGSNLLLVPASTFEKFLCSLLYTVLLFFVVFTAVYYLLDILMVSITNAVIAADEPAQKATVINVFKTEFIQLNSESAINLVLFFFSIQSLFLLGSVHFKKYSFIKTIISGFVVYIILFSLVFFLYRTCVPGGDRPDGPAQIPEWIMQVLVLLAYIIAPISWIVTYYRLKQKQV
ncbi:MAG: hypothetical protein ACR2KB_17515 [Chitinophagaceae bacterium]